MHLIRPWVGEDPISASEQDLIPLQTADLLAWTTWDAREAGEKIPTHETQGYKIFQDFGIPILDISQTNEELLAERDRMSMLRKAKGYEFETADLRKRGQWKSRNPVKTYFQNGAPLTHSGLAKMAKESVNAAMPNMPPDLKAFQLAINILAYYLGFEWWEFYWHRSLAKFHPTYQTQSTKAETP